MIPEADRNRRLYRRYAMGLEARIIGPGWTLHGHMIDLSLGGTCFVPAGPCPQAPALEQAVDLRCTEIGDQVPLLSVVRYFAADRVHLAFALDARAEDALTMFLMASPATLDMPA